MILDSEDFINIFNTKWYQKIDADISPGDALKIYRENLGLSQTELGKKLGNFSRHKISDMERGKCAIGKDIAKKLSRIFNVPVERFRINKPV